MSKDIFDETIEKFNTTIVEKSDASKFNKELDNHEKKRFKKWVLSKTKKHMLNDLINTKKKPLRIFLSWGIISLLLMLSTTLVFVGIIVVFSRFKDSISVYFIPWIYASAYIISVLFVAVPFFFWYNNYSNIKKKQKYIHDKDINT